MTIEQAYDKFLDRVNMDDSVTLKAAFFFGYAQAMTDVLKEDDTHMKDRIYEADEFMQKHFKNYRGETE